MQKFALNESTEYKIKPQGKERVDISMIGRSLRIVFGQSLRNVRESFIIAYDKKSESCLVKQKTVILQDKIMDIVFDNDFFTTLFEMKDFTYARLCVLLIWEREAACFFLTDKRTDRWNQESMKEYFGVVGEFSGEDKDRSLVVYYSAAGELSVKFVEPIRFGQRTLEQLVTEKENLRGKNTLLVQRNAYLQQELRKYSQILEQNNLILEGSETRKKRKLNYRFEVTQKSLQITHVIPEAEYEEKQSIPLKTLKYGKRVKLPMLVMPDEQERILWIYELADKEFIKTGEGKGKNGTRGFLCCYTNSFDDGICLMLFDSMEKLYKKFIHFSCKNAEVRIKGKKLCVCFEGGLYSAKCPDFSVDHVDLVIDKNHRFEIEMNLKESLNGELVSVRKEVPLTSIVQQETEINNSIHISVQIGDVQCNYNIGQKRNENIPSKYHYIPMSSAFVRDWVIFIRKNVNQNFVMVVRPKDPQEKTVQFRILESRPLSYAMYHLGIFWRKQHKRKVNLYFEKNAMKADEGTYEIFEDALQSKTSRNFFILDKHSDKWSQLSRNRNVVCKYSLKYYWLLYTADFMISTETSSHLNIHRAMNRYVRTALLEKPLIFLQHGVTYLKRQGNNSVFVKGKEGEPTYIIVGSSKEAKVVCEMLHIEPEQCIKAGLPIFGTIAHEHITDKSEDIITIMFTWKPTEEHLLSHFEDSVYFKSTFQVYEMLLKFVPEEKIRIVPHPKVLELLSTTRLREQIWDKTVAEALADTKLLITDYSSICYNAFYQGAAVIFYQPDLREYEEEVGKLIPEADEYIGYRVFQLDDLRQVIEAGITNGAVNREYLRTEEFQRRYKTINEFSDGKNIERITAFLKEVNVI